VVGIPYGGGHAVTGVRQVAVANAVDVRATGRLGVKEAYLW
jgi:hypothetical protein